MAGAASGDYIFAFYKEEKFTWKVLCVQNAQTKVRYLETLFDVKEPWWFGKKDDSVFCKEIFASKVTPKMFHKSSKWLWTYWNQTLYADAVHRE